MSEKIVREVQTTVKQLTTVRIPVSKIIEWLTEQGFEIPFDAELTHDACLGVVLLRWHDENFERDEYDE